MSFCDIAEEIRKVLDPWTEVEVIIFDVRGNIKYSDIESSDFLNALSVYLSANAQTFLVGDYYYIQNVPGVMFFKTSINSIVILRTRDRIGILLFFMKVLNKIGIEIDILLGEIKELSLATSDPLEFSNKSEREIGLFNVIATPNSDNWGERLNEEYEKINRLYLIRNDDTSFKFYKYRGTSDRLFKCKYQGIIFDIRLPMQYPFEMPIADGFYFGQWYHPAGDHKNACFGLLKNRWRKDGRYGIAHFVQFLGYYTSIAASKPMEFNKLPLKAINLSF